MATKTREIADFLVEGGADLAIVGEPHITPGVLYPAVNGMIDYDSQYTFTDSSGTPKTITSVGQAHHIGNPKIGSTSIRLDSNDYLTVPAHADFNFGTSDFCVEWWWKGNFAANGCWWSLGHTGEGWICYQESATKIRLTMGSAGTRQWDTDSSTVWQGDGEWHHFAMTKSGTTAKFYIDGTEETTINGSYTATPPASKDLSSFILGIGAMSNGGQPLNVNSNIDEFRISNHIRYSSNFTPSTTAFANDSNTKFLLHSDNGGNSGAYGTAQADGLKYYYTDIKGSQPIKDPRIGSHFGSQRYTFRSAQILEQETATHGENVWSVDGREWMRIAGNAWGTTGSGKPVHNSNAGVRIDFYSNATAFIEIVGYFNDANLKIYADTNSDQWNTNINGGTVQAQDASISVSTPLGSRYVDAHSLVNLAFNSTPTLGINTLKISVSTVTYFYVNTIELIAQDTSNVNNIQIPSQNVVSYGKKFTVAGTPHYDPFNGFTNSTSLHSAYVDTATSLGLSSAPGSSASWAISGSNNIRPYNGGRVVKWVDSSGTIKTSVNMMPANAQNISTTAAAEITTPSATNVYLPAFSDDVVDPSLAEVAKTFHIREFGNGAANQGAGGAYADASMLTVAGTSDDIAYVMDDGLTSFSGSGGNTLSGHTGDAKYGFYIDTNNYSMYLTFIGTGITGHGIDNSSDTTRSGAITDVAQNLPFGTHVLKLTRGSYPASTIHVDGVQVYSGSTPYTAIREVTFHQPKMPPIPEDAVVLADYMLMADFVPQSSAGVEYISKGVRRCSSSRDHFYDNGSPALGLDVVNANGGIKVSASSSSTTLIRNIGFGINFVRNTYGQTARSQSWYVNDTGHSSADAKTGVGSAWGSFADLDANITLGNNILDTFNVTADGNSIIHSATDTASPIHSSSHYQTFETPYLHELVGGDRNMEQTNLVVTPDGKTWDEVTRDTSYIGVHTGMFCGATPAVSAGEQTFIHYDAYRGDFATSSTNSALQKNFALAYDRVICLLEGWYTVSFGARSTSGLEFQYYLRKNGADTTIGIAANSHNGDRSGVFKTAQMPLKRGDYLQLYASPALKSESGVYNSFQITKIED